MSALIIFKYNKCKYTTSSTPHRIPETPSSLVKVKSFTKH